ncbi:hypothetical protein N7509_007970 [Penicillium cosmopolitanum]|uniref:Zn(2)-C6 fungal-type domain-containing protein n=1 Tax=Penicillium cosmopolitanum TaxID=1131564 RepID=A0A9X0B8W1_9EURO|nr:uncharacterized protein N7509_007970 [Penicillium cosmopolitanum]KAJ5392480.1 hypothetical protein N7509_007970 [Penicillium cosmopolitanum]
MSRRSSQGYDISVNNTNHPNWTPPLVVNPETSMSNGEMSIAPTRSMDLNMLQPHLPSPPIRNPVEHNNMHGSKVAIPRITGPNINRGRRRSARACEACRQRKIKCDGVKPTCGQCNYHNNQCSYEDVKRVREQKELQLLGHRVEHYEHLLRSLETEVEPHTARKIRKTLKCKGANKFDTGNDGEDSDSSVGSLEDIDEVDEDLNRDENTRAAGFFGKNSEISWMQRLEHNVDRDSTLSLSPITPFYSSDAQSSSHRKRSRDVSIHIMNYHLDDLAIPPLDDADPFAVPPRALADEYFNTYLTFVHPSFPAIRRTTYVAQYRQFYDIPSNPPRKWLGILNMIFAIGCHYAQLAEPNASRQEDDSVYLARARKLVFDENILFDHPDLQQTQLELLMALYLLCLGQINRSSKFSNMALHSALSLGINLRNTDGRIHDGAKEARGRLWWSIYSLEHLLISMNGRASCVGDSLCSVPLPMPAEEEAFDDPEVQLLVQNSTRRENQLRPTLLEKQTQRKQSAAWIASRDPSPSLFFHHLVDLTLISQAVLGKVYSIEGIRESASQTEFRIQSYSRNFDRWVSKLTPSYQFSLPDTGYWKVNPNLDDDSLPCTRERVCLAMNYYSARITLCRPCLTQSSSTPPNASPNPANPQQSQPSARAKLRAEMATNCLQAACSLISILPDTPELSWIAHKTPWWSVLHFLMQSTTALLLGLSYCSFSSPPMNVSVDNSEKSTSQSSNTTPSWTPPRPLLEADLNIAVAGTKKALMWIHTMAEMDPAACRAFKLCDGLVQKIAPGLALDLSDWPSAETLPGGDIHMDERLTRLDDLVDFEGGAGEGYFD